MIRILKKKDLGNPFITDQVVCCMIVPAIRGFAYKTYLNFFSVSADNSDKTNNYVNL